MLLCLLNSCMSVSHLFTQDCKGSFQLLIHFASLILESEYLLSLLTYRERKCCVGKLNNFPKATCWAWGQKLTVILSMAALAWAASYSSSCNDYPSTSVCILTEGCLLSVIIWLKKKTKQPKPNKTINQQTQEAQRFEGVSSSRQLDGDSGDAVIDLVACCRSGLAVWEEVAVVFWCLVRFRSLLPCEPVLPWADVIDCGAMAWDLSREQSPDFPAPSLCSLLKAAGWIPFSAAQKLHRALQEHS